MDAPTMTTVVNYERVESPLLEELALPAPRPHGRAVGGSSPMREPRTVQEALEDVCRRFCTSLEHDPTCRLITGELKRLRAATVPRVIPSRTTDPATSRAAEPRRVTADNARGRLLAAFHHVGPQGTTDEGAARVAGVSMSSEYAKRCSELRQAGYLEETGETRPGASGHERIVSRVTHAGAAALAAAGVPAPPTTPRVWIETA